MSDDNSSWIGPLIQIGASMLGEQKAGALTAQQSALLRQVYDDLRNVPLPELEAVAAEQLGPSAMGGTYSDPEQRHQQMEVMNELRDLFTGTGFSPEDDAMLAEGLNRASVTGNAQRKALQSEFAQRGQLGGGARLAMGNAQAQGAANRANSTALGVAAEGSRRKSQAMAAYADLAGDVRKADFGEGSARAQAKDAAERWNAGAREKAGIYNAGLGQQQFNNRIARATGSQTAGGNLAGHFAQESQAVRNQHANYGRAGAEIVNGLTDDEDDE